MTGSQGVRSWGCRPTRGSGLWDAVSFDTELYTLLSWNPGANSNHGIYTVRQDATHVGFGGYQTNFGGKLKEGYATYSTTLP